MANELVEVQSQSKGSVVLNNLSVLATPDGFQKYIMGTKKNGQPRALYDIIKDQTGGKKKKKGKKGKKSNSTFDLYMSTSSPKKKKKKKKGKKKNKHWHI